MIRNGMGWHLTWSPVIGFMVGGLWLALRYLPFTTLKMINPWVSWGINLYKPEISNLKTCPSLQQIDIFRSLRPAVHGSPAVHGRRKVIAAWVPSLWQQHGQPKTDRGQWCYSWWIHHDTSWYIIIHHDIIYLQFMWLIHQLINILNHNQFHQSKFSGYCGLIAPNPNH